MTDLCNFCGKGPHEVNKIIIGENAGICNKCIKLCSEILVSEKSKDTGTVLADVDPIELKKHLDKFIVSQDKAKEILSVAVANHCKRINCDSYVIEKSNVMLLGPSGSGKTLIVSTIAEYLNIPYAIADATRLTEAGYHGDDVDTFLIQLLQRAGGNVAKAESGIVFIDEIDKIAKKNNSDTKEIGGEGVQQALLKLVEGSTFSIMPNKKTEALVDINTSNILFIASGAFVGLDTLKRKKKAQTKIGFNADVQDKSKAPETESADLLAYGLIQEFVGRFPIIAEVDELSNEDMLDVLNNVENNLVTQYKHLFNYSNVGLAFDEDALAQVVHIAKSKKTGARGLRTIMEKTLLPHMFNMAKYKENNINDVQITKSLITNPREVKKI